MAIQTLHPGVFTQEEGRTPSIPNAGVTAMGFVGPAERGPTGDAGFITNMRQFDQLYGEEFDGSWLRQSVKGALDQTGGSGQVFISRVAPDDATIASGSVEGLDGNDSLEVQAENEGDWGNNVRIQTQRYGTLTTQTVNAGDTEIHVEQIKDFEIGDIIRINDGTNSTDTIVTGINIGSKSVDVVEIDSSLSSSINSGAVVYSSTIHEYSDTLSQGFTSGDGRITVNSSTGAKKGQRILMTDGTTVNYATITQVDGNEIQFDSAVINGDLPSDSIVVSLEYQLEVYELNELRESYRVLSNVTTNRERYVEFALKGTSNQSIVVEVSAVGSENMEDSLPIGPKPDVQNGNVLLGTTELSGGDDGTQSNIDYIGLEEEGTGLHAFDGIQEIALLAVPGISDPNRVKAIDSWVEGRGDMLYVADAPETDTSALELRNYRLNELNLNSSFTMLVAPWVNIPDPQNRDNTITAPPSGFVLGQISNTNATRGVHVSPANEGGLNGVIEPAVDFTDSEYDLLYTKGVNLIRSFPGEGTLLFGGRTLWQQRDGFEYVNIRNTVNFVKTSLATGLRFALFEPNNRTLWRQIRGTVNRFLSGMWRDGALIPQDNPDDAFFVKVDEENNPISARNQGELHVDVGIQPPPPAEFVILTVGLMGGAVNQITEETA